MADRLPLVLNPSNGLAQELPATDDIALSALPTSVQQLAAAMLTTIAGAPIVTMAGDFMTQVGA